MWRRGPPSDPESLLRTLPPQEPFRGRIMLDRLSLLTLRLIQGREMTMRVPKRRGQRDDAFIRVNRSPPVPGIREHHGEVKVAQHLLRRILNGLSIAPLRVG